MKKINKKKITKFVGIKNSSSFVAVILLLILVTQGVVFARDFIDVKPTFWAYKQIRGIQSPQKIFEGANYYFYPDKYVTRSEYCAMIVRVLGLRYSDSKHNYIFEDLNKNHWAWNDINLAVNYDILKPDKDNYFHPDSPVSREEMVTFMVNILPTENIPEKEALSALRKYLDYDYIPDWFKVTAGKAEVLNVIINEPSRYKYLDCDKYLTRAQFVVMAYNLKKELDKLKKIKYEKLTTPKKSEGIQLDNVYNHGHIATIPAETIIPIMIIGQLSSDDAEKNQKFKAKFPKDIVDKNNNLLLSKDADIRGKVMDTSKSMFLIKNGKIKINLYIENENKSTIRLLGITEYKASNVESNIFKKVTKSITKGKEIIFKDGQIIYIKLSLPLSINIITGDIVN